MYYIVLGEFAGLFYSPVNWESFSTWHTAEISGKLTEPELALNGQSHAGIEETALCYAQAQIDEMGLRRKWNCLAQGFMVAVPGKGCTTTERILMLWCLTAAV